MKESDVYTVRCQSEKIEMPKYCHAPPTATRSTSEISALLR